MLVKSPSFFPWFSQVFHHLTGLRVDLILKNGFKIEGKGEVSPYCRQVGRMIVLSLDLEIRQACKREEKKYYQKAIGVKKILAYTCHAGLTDIVCPIIYHHQDLGYLSSGQFLSSPPSLKKFERIERKFREKKIGGNYQLLKNNFFGVPVFSEFKKRIVESLLSSLSSAILEREAIENFICREGEEDTLLLEKLGIKKGENFKKRLFKIGLKDSSSLLTQKKMEEIKQLCDRIILISQNTEKKSYLKGIYDPFVFGVILLFKASKSFSQKYFLGVARKIKGAVRENLRTEIAIGISPEFHAPNQTYPAYLKARYGALINLIRSENHFFYPFPLEKRQIFLDELIQGVKKKSDESSVDVWIDRLLLPLFTPFLYRVVQWNVLKILCELSAKFPEKYPPGRLLSFASNILQLKTISELYQWTHQFLKMQIRIIQGIPKSYEVVNEIKKYVQDNYTSSSLKTLLSQKTKYSSTYLETLFRKQMGKGIAAYLTEIRIKRAKELLRETELTISEIAFEVGYNTFSTFYRAFKRMEKMAPAEYRAKVKGGE